MEKKKVKKVLKIILIIIAILIILVLIHTIRNFIIVSQLQSKITEYTKINNYHIKITENQEDGAFITVNYYKKDNKQAYFLERNKDGEVIKMSSYSDGTKTHRRYTETPDYKTVNFEQSQFLGIAIGNVLENDNTWQNILASMMAQIKSVEYKGKICYEITNYASQHLFLGLEKNTVYIEKDKGLLIKANIDYSNAEYEYEFNNVNDTIFIEPDISQYQVYEK